MGAGDKRSHPRFAKLVSRDLARRAAGAVGPARTGAAEPRTPEAKARDLAAGTQEVPSAPLMSRTATLDDPLTTSLLAEVARRTKTIEVSADQIDEAKDIELGDADPPAEPAPRPRR